MVSYLCIIGISYLVLVAGKPMPLSIPRKIIYRSFTLVEVPSLGPKRLDDSWTSTSKLSCARSCMEKYDNCWSFLYNTSTRICTPGSSFDHQQPRPTAEEGQLYSSVSCTSRFFQMYRRNITTACVAEFTSANYSDAYENCRSFGGVLMSVRTNDKMVILLTVADPSDSWVGCDDLDNDGIFTWRDNNEILSEDEIRMFFVSRPTSHCVNYNFVDMKLTSNDCSLPMSYFCEIPLP